MKQRKLFNTDTTWSRPIHILTHTKWANLAHIWEKVNTKLLELMYCKDKSKLSKSNQVFFILHNRINNYFKKNLSNFLNQNFENIESFFEKLNLFIEELINEYKNILVNQLSNYNFYDISEKSINKSISFLERILILNNNKLENMTGIWTFDFNNTENNWKNINNDNLVDQIKNAIKKKNYEIDSNLFNSFINNISSRFINDIRQIFWLIRFGDDNFTDWVHQSYWLEPLYTYDSNIYYFAYALNKIYTKRIKDIKESLNMLKKLSKIEITPREINLLVYIWLKKFLQLDK